ncbi:DNA-binding response OmpR family regulator [Desulfobaculum xiamenense]|uniref:DNA-binding response OmpR family regulator n=1 Tax=Desulfobaculum xiamenense TaxID=995050 RepID=A0A846QDE5_9BACT|nr:response regulator [Desulfobaculum xiamenense]NJB66746.1 DNA-binding response OmpR family regulator [Desulfobaculum xiamenense]
MTARKEFFVLALETNPSLRKILATYLNKGGFAGAAVTDSVPDALRLLGEDKRYLVLCDLVVGKHSGIALLQKLRATPRFHALPFVIMSAKKEQAIIVAAARAGASGFLVKPFTEETMLAALDKALIKSATPAQDKQKKGADRDLVEAGFRCLDDFDEEKAIALFTKAVKQNPHNAEALRGLAYAFKARKDIPRFSQFMLAAGKAQVANGEYAEADKVFLEHKRHDATAPNPYSESAKALAEKEDFEKAAHLFERAGVVEPDNAAHFLGGAQALIRLGKPDAAKDKLKAALAISDDLGEARKLWKAVTGESWTKSDENEKAKAKKAEKEEKREAVRFWVPDLLVAPNGYDEHFAIVELSLHSVAFSPQEKTFEVGQSFGLHILKLTEDGVKPELKGLSSTVSRIDEEKVGCTLDQLTTEQEEHLGKILLAAQERQMAHYREEKKEITFDIDMLFI